MLQISVSRSIYLMIAVTSVQRFETKCCSESGQAKSKVFIHNAPKSGIFVHDVTTLIYLSIDRFISLPIICQCIQLFICRSKIIIFPVYHFPLFPSINIYLYIFLFICLFFNAKGRRGSSAVRAWNFSSGGQGLDLHSGWVGASIV